ncbi:hypothetical protein BKA70DRAFT_1306840 [Coprinopsis sp. MPI-PUGE-AT-0042]|nr:hypothetical protein BKA70DRAFT_1306840 [Coprinopsis sp. MPI-PUGE-AT-0042]
MIIFYDVACSGPQRTLSPNTWKTRLSLNYKGLPYTTKWIDFPDIRALYDEVGAEPHTGFLGTPEYSLPLIVDDSTGARVGESLAIAKYLDVTYPDTPQLVPNAEDGGMEKQAAFVKELEMGLVQAALPLIFRQGFDNGNLTPRGREYIARTRVPFLAMMGHNVTSADELQISPEEKDVHWGKLRDFFGVMSEKFGGEGKFSWLMGDTISFADLVMGSWLLSQRGLWGENSKEWNEMMSWNGGKWAEVINKLKDYQTII